MRLSSLKQLHRSSTELGTISLQQKWRNIFLIMAAEPTLAQLWQEMITETAQIANTEPTTESNSIYDTPRKLIDQSLPLTSITEVLRGMAWGLWWGDSAYGNANSQRQSYHVFSNLFGTLDNDNHDHKILIHHERLIGIIYLTQIALHHDYADEPRQWLAAIRDLWQDHDAQFPNNPIQNQAIQELDTISDLLDHVSPIEKIMESLSLPWSVALYLILSSPWQPKLILQRVNLLEKMPTLAPLRAEVSLLVQMWVATSGIYDASSQNMSEPVKASTVTLANQWFAFWAGAMANAELPPMMLINYSAW
ncbi:MAG: hypothetical protein WCO45_01040 [Pseudanabaena sp. ELA607]